MERGWEFSGQQQIQGPLFQQIPFQASGVQCLRALIILLSRRSASRLLVPPRRLLWVANVYSLHLAPSQEELIGPKPRHYLLLWHQEPPAEVTIRGTSWEQPNRGHSAGTWWWGWGLPVGHPCAARGRAVGKLPGGRGAPGHLEKEKLAHEVGASKNKPSLLPPCHNTKRLAPGVSLPPEIMPGAATAPHGDALSMPPVSMVTARNVARVTGRRASWDLALKTRIWGCWVSFSPPSPPLVLFLGFPLCLRWPGRLLLLQRPWARWQQLHRGPFPTSASPAR